jgi:hypothetical protein
VKFVLPILCCFVATQTQAQTTVVPQTYPGAPPRPTVAPQPTPTVGVVGGGGAPLGQSIDEWLTYPWPAPASPPLSQPPSTQPPPVPRAPKLKVEWPPPSPAVALRPVVQPQESAAKVPESKWSGAVTRTIDDMKAGIEEVVTKTVDGQKTVIKYVVRRNPGGSIELHVAYWTLVAIQGGEVEIRGPCGSACTLAVVAIPKDKLCFDADGYLGFHMATSLNKDGSTLPDLKTTRGMVESYPKDIRAWINAKGGYKKMPIDGVWTLPASDLWKMGYRRCAD